MRIGYARVSTDEQKTHAQTDALKAAGCEVIFEEHRSGGTTKRPELIKMLAQLQSGDVVIVYKMDRIARSLRDLMDITEIIHKANAQFRSLTEIIDTTTPSGRFIFQIFGAFAEFERELIRERTKVGLHAAMARGKKPGQPPKIKDSDLSKVVELFGGGMTKSAIARLYKVNISSIKRAITRHKLQQSLTGNARA